MCIRYTNIVTYFLEHLCDNTYLEYLESTLVTVCVTSFIAK
jgi:hypothetical protein